ncbi:unnamed protein product [Urochloa humidicola]
MASSCIPAGLRLDLDMVKAAGAAASASAAAVPPRPAHSAAASSTLSEASNASLSSSSATSSVASLSLKRPRTPRKRPNQTYNEAAALLASMYPSVFPAAGGPEAAPPRLLGLASALADDPDCSDLLPPLPVLDQAAFLLRDLPPPPPQSPAPVPMPMSPAPAKSCPSPPAVSSVFSEFRDPAPSPATPDTVAADEPGELDFDDDDGFDADSILCGVDESAAEGVDGIMGKLSMENNEAVAAVSSGNSNLSRSKIHPYLRNLMVLGLSFRQDQRNINQALKRHNVDPEWWMCPAIPVKDIAPPPPPLPLPVVAKPMVSEKKKETGLGLRLNAERVLKAWRGRGSVFADRNASELPLSSAHVVVKHEDNNMFPENGTSAVIREGNILKMQRKQKTCNPVPSNKNSRYYRPRINGRFVSKACFLQLQQQQASEKET